MMSYSENEENAIYKWVHIPAICFPHQDLVDPKEWNRKYISYFRGAHRYIYMYTEYVM